ncbi:hypothetical protein SAMN05421678_10641 [Actinopolymorpha cephalotaxi]|uniref:Uncharacterized protein n=1 Tax=Actinopolymorpha cephalotaxi TaxID=504797 RepID=A0A1I2RYM3_9ACTN|nr:hypothetical protein [Actinopolymorpha cephalotaxi]SFG45658.1 hypothetical protein SAMN05421678_10641 [Actinopolymorpha cephalotaxi]
MARYPHADWDPHPEATSQPRIRPWGVVLHTAVSNAKNIKNAWLQSSVESHCWVQGRWSAPRRHQCVKRLVSW